MDPLRGLNPVANVRPVAEKTTAVHISIKLNITKLTSRSRFTRVLGRRKKFDLAFHC